MATIVDISKKVGVACSTVSRVLSGSGRISQVTKEAVLKAAKELNYQPNAIARSLVQKKTDIIGLVIPSYNFRSHYLTTLVSECQEFVVKTNRNLLITQMKNMESTGLDEIHFFSERRCDAIIYYRNSYLGTCENDEKLCELIDNLPVPLIILNDRLPTHLNNCVWIDQKMVAKKPVEYLINHGHSQIAYISGPMNRTTAQERYMGYSNAILEANITNNPLLVVEGGLDYQDGYLACKKLIQRNVPFTGLCCFNDNLAVGALKALIEAEISVPDQVSLFGMDESPELDFHQPPISSFELPIAELANHALKLVESHICGSPAPERNETFFAGRLTIRGSVKALC